ncbi:MAG: toxin-antitoxin system YwqK family antitoxin [Bacteroidetes bacterium]|nr:toxin-antitoxin system YwqK family antitoxin [Bacteroidota bacterium]
MKKIFSILLLFTLTNCGDSIDDQSKRNENWCWFLDEKTGKGTWFQIGNDEWKETGKVTYFFMNGNVGEISKLKNGIRCDTSYYYDLKGNLIRYTTYSNDQQNDYYLNDGLYKAYYMNGNICDSGFIKSNKRINKWTSFSKSGKIRWTENHLDSTRIIFICYYETGQIKDSVNFYNHLQNGEMKKWFENGNLKSISNWKDGKEIGEATHYFESGKLHKKLTWIEDKKVSVIEWDESGKEINRWTENVE